MTAEHGHVQGRVSTRRRGTTAEHGYAQGRVSTRVTQQTVVVFGFCVCIIRDAKYIMRSSAICFAWLGLYTPGFVCSEPPVEP